MVAKLLIVEDEILVALELEHVAQAAGFEVVGIAADRQSALSVGEQADIALVDLNLRDGATGTQIGTALASGRGVRVIFVTANPGQIGDAAALALGVIAKPFSAETVRRVITLAASGPPYDNVASGDAGIAGFTPLGMIAGCVASPCDAALVATPIVATPIPGASRSTEPQSSPQDPPAATPG